jgi:hypothetical protein
MKKPEIFYCFLCLLVSIRYRNFSHTIFVIIVVAAGSRGPTGYLYRTQARRRVAGARRTADRAKEDRRAGAACAERRGCL